MKIRGTHGEGGRKVEGGRRVLGAKQLGYQPSTRRRDESDPDDEVAGDNRFEYPLPHNRGGLRQLWTQ